MVWREFLIFSECALLVGPSVLAWHWLSSLLLQPTACMGIPNREPQPNTPLKPSRKPFLEARSGAVSVFAQRRHQPFGRGVRVVEHNTEGDENGYCR